MKFRKAVRKMSEGCEVYRPHWKAGTHLRMLGDGSIVKEEKNIGITGYYWKANADDILADDWETEVYVSLICNTG